VLYRLGQLLVVPALVALAAVGLLLFLGCRMLLSLVAPPVREEDPAAAPPVPFPERRRRAATLLR
jgi:hypothetical protein